MCRCRGTIAPAGSGTGGLPGVSIVYRQQLLEVAANARRAEQPVRDFSGPVGEGDHTQAVLAQDAYPVGDIRVHAEIGETGQDMARRVVSRLAEGGTGQHGLQRASGQTGECFLIPRGRQREPVPEEGGEPHLGEQFRGADVGEPVRKWRHVGQRFVDVEHDHARTRLHLLLLSVADAMTGTNPACGAQVPSTPRSETNNHWLRSQRPWPGHPRALARRGSCRAAMAAFILRLCVGQRGA